MLGLIENPALVAFKAEEVIASQFLRDEAGAFLLAVHGVGGDQRSRRQVQLFEQGLEGGDLVAFFFDRYLAERQTQVMGYGRE